MRLCPDCNSSVSKQASFCDTCGYPLEQISNQENSASKSIHVEASGTCSACGYVNIPGETFCQQCGVQLPPVLSSPPPPPTPVHPQSMEFQAVWQKHDQQEAEFQIPSNCIDCGFNLNAGDKFCPNCGFDLSTPQQPSENIPDNVEPLPTSPPPVVGTKTSSPILGIHRGLCPSCGQSFTTGETYCQICGYKLAPAQTSDEIVQEPEHLSDPEYKEASKSTGSTIDGTCPICGEKYGDLSEDPFCSNCGQYLLTIPEEEVSTLETGPMKAEAPEEEILVPMEVKGRLVVSSTDKEIFFPDGQQEVMIGRTDPERNIFPDIDLTSFGGSAAGVSRRHVRIMVQASQMMIQDLGSTNFTYLNKSKLDPNQSYPLNNGDEIRMAGIILYYYDA